MAIHRNRLLRNLFLKLFSRINPGDITVRHHFTAKPLRLHSFKHKGYWFHGRNREATTMSLFKQIVEPGYNVFDVGGHIGYVATYFALLAGEFGKVCVFEPGPNNLPYLQKNCEHWPNISIIPSAVGNNNGEISLFLEDLTGQNNSIVKDFAAYKKNADFANVQSQTQEVEVRILRLDDFVASEGIVPDFVKIDVEGAELDVVLGMCISMEQYQPALMIEFNSIEHQIYHILQEHNYHLFTPTLEVINDPGGIQIGNVFALSKTRHQQMIMHLGF
jgi:FkbM family methyltransferase